MNFVYVYISSICITNIYICTYIYICIYIHIYKIVDLVCVEINLMDLGQAKLCTHTGKQTNTSTETQTSVRWMNKFVQLQLWTQSSNIIACLDFRYTKRTNSILLSDHILFYQTLMPDNLRRGRNRCVFFI